MWAEESLRSQNRDRWWSNMGLGLRVCGREGKTLGWVACRCVRPSHCWRDSRPRSEQSVPFVRCVTLDPQQLECHFSVCDMGLQLSGTWACEDRVGLPTPSIHSFVQSIASAMITGGREAGLRSFSPHSRSSSSCALLCSCSQVPRACFLSPERGLLV